ncbi:MAG: amidohydrolase family protein [Planctomycetaceae bacterium]|jgi:cytosine/adenosine deaminase-related metal-dependent hydrolase|nr:amidohydrolase family protein [Planctomycetaceae bacterium]
MTLQSITANQIHTMTNVDGGQGTTGLIERKYINIENDKILSVSSKPQFDDIIDFQNQYDILPGMINAHAHLELSQLESPLELENIYKSQNPSTNNFSIQKIITNNYSHNFDQWINQLMRFRRSSVYDSTLAISAAKQYFAENNETAAVVDIIPFDFNPNQIDIGKNIEWIRHLELIAWDSITVTKKIKTICNLPKNSYSGLSPHAPHTVSADLIEFAVNFGVPISMHLAESPDEIRLLKSYDGKLFEMMRKIDENYEPSKILAGNRAMDYLQILSRAKLSLVIHCNYLDDSEIQFLAKNRETMAVVYTPRSHDYFGFGDFPLQKMLDNGVCVLLGTDSKASTPDLSLSNEIKRAVFMNPIIPLETFFQMTTIHAAKFLGLIENYGTIESGKKAVFTLFRNIC